jgi:hypothetical protein
VDLAVKLFLVMQRSSFFNSFHLSHSLHCRFWKSVAGLILALNCALPAATFTVTGSTLAINLTAANESVAITAGAANDTLALTGGTRSCKDHAEAEAANTRHTLGDKRLLS